MRDTNDRPAAPNFTNACIVLFGVNLLWVLTVIWAVWGIVAVALMALFVNRLITMLEAALNA